MALSLFLTHTLVWLTVILDGHKLSAVCIALLPVAIVALKLTAILHRTIAVSVVTRRIGCHDLFLAVVVVVERWRKPLAALDEAIVGRARIRIVRIAVLTVGRGFRADLARPVRRFELSVHSKVTL